MRRLLFLAFLAFLLTVGILGQPTPAWAQTQEHDEVAPKLVHKRDPEMNAAIAEARRTLPEFLAVLDRPPPGSSGFVFKYPLGGYEHIWVTNVRRVGARLAGQLDDFPIQEGFHRGDPVSVPLSMVSDWAYRDARGVMQGHRTTRVLLPRLSPDEAAGVKAYLGWAK